MGQNSVKLLIDTNIFLEGLLKQNKSEQVKRFFASTNPKHTCMSRFTLHSVAYILLNRKLFFEFNLFIEGIAMQTEILDLSVEDLSEISDVIMPSFRLDFDDAFQYLCAKKYNCNLISFDRDFDRTDLKRVEP